MWRCISVSHLKMPDFRMYLIGEVMQVPPCGVGQLGTFGEHLTSLEVDSMSSIFITIELSK